MLEVRRRGGIRQEVCSEASRARERVAVSMWSPRGGQSLRDRQWDNEECSSSEGEPVVSLEGPASLNHS